MYTSYTIYKSTHYRVTMLHYKSTSTHGSFEYIDQINMHTHTQLTVSTFLLALCTRRVTISW